MGYSLWCRWTRSVYDFNAKLYGRCSIHPRRAGLSHLPHAPNFRTAGDLFLIPGWTSANVFLPLLNCRKENKHSAVFEMHFKHSCSHNRWGLKQQLWHSRQTQNQPVSLGEKSAARRSCSTVTVRRQPSAGNASVLLPKIEFRALAQRRFRSDSDRESASAAPAELSATRGGSGGRLRGCTHGRARPSCWRCGLPPNPASTRSPACRV